MPRALEVEYFQKPALTTNFLQGAFITETSIPGLLVIQRPVNSDFRGDLTESFRLSHLISGSGGEIIFRQGNRSRNLSAGTIRGLHLAPWIKLVTVMAGAAFMVAVDFRLNSPTFGRVFTETLGEGGKDAWVYVPAGFAHGYQALVDETVYYYLVTEEWTPDQEVGVRWNDWNLGIRWPIPERITLNGKDTSAPFVASAARFPDFVERVQKTKL